MSIRLCDLIIAQEKSKIKAGEGKTKGDYKFFTSSNIQTKYVDFFQYDKPALIFGTGGMPSIHYCDEPFSTSTDCIVFYAKNNRYSLKSLYLFFESHMNLLEEGFHGAGLQHISKKYLLDIQIPDIPIEQQLKINNIGDKLNRLIDIRKNQLENYNSIVKSRFIEMFGDSVYNTNNLPIFKLKTLCKIGSSKRIYQNEQTTSGIPFLRVSDLNNRIDFGIDSCDLFIPIKKYEELDLQGLVPKKGDILVTSRGTIGKCYIVKSQDCFYFQDGMISWLSNIDKRVSSIYLAYLFSTENIQKQIERLQSGSTVAYLSIDMLKKLNIMLPDIEGQNDFEIFFKQADKSKLAIEKSIEKLEILKKSLMQEYFG